MDTDKVYIRCIGEDRLIHICEPHESVTKCGVKIIRKNPNSIECIQRFSCYECTY